VESSHTKHTRHTLHFTPSLDAFAARLTSLTHTDVDADAVWVCCDACLAFSTGMLSQALQDKAIKPRAGGRRRIVLASPVAESSLTIPGVRVSAMMCSLTSTPPNSLFSSCLLSLACPWRPRPCSATCPS